MTTLATFIGVAAYLATYVTILKRTFLAISPQRHQLSGAIFLMNNCLFIIPALFIVPIYGAEQIRVLRYVENDSVIGIHAIVIFSMLTFVLCFALLSSVLGRLLFYDMRKVYRDLENPVISSRVLAFCRIMLLSIPAAIMVNIVVFGGQHALFGAAFYDLNAGAIRHENESSVFAAYAKHYFHVISLLVAPCLALPIYRRRHTERVISVVLVFAALTSHGSKSPFIFFLIVLFFAMLEKSALNAGRSDAYAMFSAKRVMFAVFGLLSAFLAFYFFATTFFLGENNAFWDYFWNRAFIGQMAGMYEQFNLFLFDPSFSWHSVPFASLLIDYPSFHKELMLVSENLVDPDRIGIKVTFFSAEAYGMFGWSGVVIAPFLLAIQFVMTFLLLNAAIDRLILRNRELSKYVTSFFFVAYFSFTDGISEMLLLKGAIFVLVLMLPVIFCMVLRGTWMSYDARRSSFVNGRVTS
ncbi:MAG: hypothetical protein AB8B71_07885 [Paracoccaceae bacterium]